MAFAATMGHRANVARPGRVRQSYKEPLALRGLPAPKAFVGPRVHTVQLERKVLVE